MRITNVRSPFQLILEDCEEACPNSQRADVRLNCMTVGIRYDPFTSARSGMECLYCAHSITLISHTTLIVIVLWPRISALSIKCKQTSVGKTHRKENSMTHIIPRANENSHITYALFQYPFTRKTQTRSSIMVVLLTTPQRRNTDHARDRPSRSHASFCLVRIQDAVYG